MLLKQGTKGRDVKRLQEVLNKQLLSKQKLVPDGDFGQKTTDAVIAFQKVKGLKADGIAGAKTLAALGIEVEQAAALLTGGPPSWLAFARQEEKDRVTEIKGAKKNNLRIVEYLKTCSTNKYFTVKSQSVDETPWCSAFVNWVMQQDGKDGTNNALASSWLSWGDKLEEPKMGAITVVRKVGAKSDAKTGSATGNHVAFVVGLTDKSISLLGGNQNNGTMVCTRSFSLSSYEVRGYRWPK